jgi:hypothetical protein
MSVHIGHFSGILRSSDDVSPYVLSLPLPTLKYNPARKYIEKMRSKGTEHQEPNVNHNAASMRWSGKEHILHGTCHLKDKEYMKKRTGTVKYIQGNFVMASMIYIYVVVVRGALQQKSHLCIPEKEFRGLSSSNSNSNSNAR